jgi:hypothetical protein
MEVGIEKGRACRASSVGLVAAIRGGEQRDPLHTVCHKIEVVQVSQGTVQGKRADPLSRANPENRGKHQAVWILQSHPD